VREGSSIGSIMGYGAPAKFQTGATRHRCAPDKGICLLLVVVG
jgi:hypothetical protein